LEDAEIKKALADYDVRFAQQIKNLKDILETTLTTMPTVLTQLITEYAAEGVPAAPKTESWCVIT
jgi:hypothetical protein